MIQTVLAWLSTVEIKRRAERKQIARSILIGKHDIQRVEGHIGPRLGDHHGGSTQTCRR
jgi:hypothetical protein